MIDAAYLRLSQRIDALERELDRRRVEAPRVPTAPAQISSGGQTTTSGTIVDISGATITLTTYGGNVDVEATVRGHNNTAGQWVQVRLVVDTVNTDEVGTETSTTGGDFWTMSCAFRLAPAAGSHTIKLGWLVSGGTGTADVVHLRVAERPT